PELLGKELVEADQRWDAASACTTFDLDDPVVVELARGWFSGFEGGRSGGAQGEGNLAGGKEAVHTALLGQLDAQLTDAPAVHWLVALIGAGVARQRREWRG